MKDLVDHIRTVHFTVFVVALILTVALHGERRPRLDRAASDAEAILLLQERWLQVSNGLIKAADTVIDHSFVVTDAQGLDVVVHRETGLYATQSSDAGSGRPVIFEVRRRWIYVDETEPDENPGWGESEELLDRLPDPWKNFGEFVKFWDDFHNGNRAFLPFMLATKGGAAYCQGVKRSPGNKVKDEPPVTAFLVPAATHKGGWRLSAHVEIMGHDVNVHKQGCDFAPLHLPSIKLDLGSIFAEIAPQAKKWGIGKSDDEFKELIAETKYLKALPLDQLAGALRERANSDTERVELFQAKLPVEAMATYGALVLIISQFYLLAHLLELRRVARTVPRPDWPTGYVGLYEDRLIFALTIAFTALWPPFPLLLVVGGRTIIGSSLYFAWTALTISSAIAIASVATLTLIRRTEAPRGTNDGGIGADLAQ